MRPVPLGARSRRNNQTAVPAQQRMVAGALLHLAGRLAEDRPLTDVLRRAVELIPEMLQVTTIALLRHDAAGDVDRVIAELGTSGDLAQRPLTRGEMSELAGTFDTLGFTILDRSAAPRPLHERLLDSLAAERVLALPLRYGSARVGLLLLGDPSSGEFSAAELGLARGVADQISLAVATGRLREDNARRTRELAALHSAALATGGALEMDVALRSICDQVARAFDADGAAILTYNHDRTMLHGAHLGGEGRSEQEIALWRTVRLPVTAARATADDLHTDRTRIITDIDELPPDQVRLARHLGLRSLMIVSLQVEGERAGMLLVGDRRPGMFGFADVPLVEAMAEHAGTAIARGRTYEELERSARRILDQKTELEGILTHLSDGLMLADAERRVMLVNPAARAILGIEHGTIWAARQEAELWRAVTPEGAPIDPDDLPLARALAGDRGPARDLEILLDGQVRIVSVSAAPLTTQEGRLHGAVAVLRDVTDVRRGQERVAESERLRAVGEMASGVAHDFNNLLGVILGRCELLLGPAPAMEPQRSLREGLEVIRQAALDGAETVKRLQAFSGVSRFTPEEAMDLGRIVRDVVEFARPRWKDAAQQRGITIRMETEVEPLPPIQGSPAELREVLLNMVFNAVDAMPQGGVIGLSVRRQDDQVLLRVQDDGLGMTETVRRRVFEPFFSTKGTRGAGLGLSMSYGIIQRMGGHIEVESTLYQGTAFTIVLPFRPAEAREARGLMVESQPLTVLLVDDEAQMLRTTALMLEMDGHTVTPAESGSDALLRLHERGGTRNPYDVILTDLGMPGMNGIQLVAAVRAAGIATPCVLVTGWGLEVSDGDLADSGAQAVLPKPFSAEQLRAILATIAARRPAQAA